MKQSFKMIHYRAHREHRDFLKNFRGSVSLWFDFFLNRDTCPGGRCQGARQAREDSLKVFLAIFAPFAVNLFPPTRIHPRSSASYFFFCSPAVELRAVTLNGAQYNCAPNQIEGLA
jgi:hypothetical protein